MAILAAVRQVDTVGLGSNTAALVTVSPAHASPTTAPRRTAAAAQTGAIRRAVIQTLALAAHSTATAAPAKTSADQGYATPATATPIWEARVLTVNVGPALRGTRHVRGRSLGTVARLMGTVGVRMSIVGVGIVIRGVKAAEQQYRQHLVSESRYSGLRDNTPGLYIHPVVQRWPLFWSNACRLLLPFDIGAAGWARESNGQPLGLGDIDFWDEEPRGRAVRGDLYQAGMTNGITNSHLVQIDKLLNKWADCVESGDWTVDADGVAGGIEKFREADTEEHWRKYWIPPSW
ncbi:uncharacterized protein BDV14DRAFT_198834 [Aspergillus stella-maris]|uniref:uncharacterized protein n=1 Tax=Aspergillus stella-maris TaxID=1810926 RepID=UPI003CCD33C6